MYYLLNSIKCSFFKNYSYDNRLRKETLLGDIFKKNMTPILKENNFFSNFCVLSKIIRLQKNTHILTLNLKTYD